MSVIAEEPSAHEKYVERVKADYEGPKYHWFVTALDRDEYTKKTKDSHALHVLNFEDSATTKQVLRITTSDVTQERTCTVCPEFQLVANGHACCLYVLHP